MKKNIFAVTAALLLACTAQTALAQGIVVNKTDGTKVYFKATEVESVTTYGYGEEPTVNPDTTVVTPDGTAPANAKAVDLGLPSGLKWANMNVGANSPQENGLYFAWGETTGYTGDTSDGRKFDWASYKWMTPDSTTWMGVNKYQLKDGETSAVWYVYDRDILGYKFVGDGKATLDPEDDAAHVNWGGKWRMPTYDEIKELLDNTTSEWITVGTVKGRKFTSKVKNSDGTYNSIFIPAAGSRYDARLYYEGTCGYVWSSSVNPWDSSIARVLYFDSSKADCYGGDRYEGQSVRPVTEQ